MVSFGGLVINYLQVSQREAYLLSNDELSDALAIKLAAFKAFLEIVMFCSLGGYGALALWRAAGARRHTPGPHMGPQGGTPVNFLRSTNSKKDCFVMF